jgi:hypothetical protein
LSHKRKTNNTYQKQNEMNVNLILRTFIVALVRSSGAHGVECQATDCASTSVADRATLNINVSATTPKQPTGASQEKHKETRPLHAEGQWSADGKTWTGSKGTGRPKGVVGEFPDQSASASGEDQESFIGGLARTFEHTLTYALFSVCAILRSIQKNCAVFFTCSLSVDKNNAVGQSVATLHSIVKPNEKSPVQSTNFQVFVKLSSKTITVDACPSDTIAAIKRRVQDKEGVPPQQLRLQYKGKELTNNRSVGDCNVTRESTLHGSFRLRGGGPSSSNNKQNANKKGKGGKKRKWSRIHELEAAESLASLRQGQPAQNETKTFRPSVRGSPSRNGEVPCGRVAPWQSNTADAGMRRQRLQQIARMLMTLESEGADTDGSWKKQSPKIALQFEHWLYNNSSSKENYMDLTKLRTRIAHLLKVIKQAKQRNCKSSGKASTAKDTKSEEKFNGQMRLEEYNRFSGQEAKEFKAALAMQRVWRRYCVREQTKEIKSTRENAVLIMQCIWRRYCVRRQADLSGSLYNDKQSQSGREIMDHTLDEVPQSEVKLGKRKRVVAPECSLGKKRQATRSRSERFVQDAQEVLCSTVELCSMEHHIGRHYIIRINDTNVWVQGTVMRADTRFVYYRLQNDPQDANLRQEKIAIFVNRMSARQRVDFMWIDEKEMEDCTERDYFRCICGKGIIKHRCARVWVCEMCNRAIGEGMRNETFSQDECEVEGTSPTAPIRHAEGCLRAGKQSGCKIIDLTLDEEPQSEVKMGKRKRVVAPERSSGEKRRTETVKDNDGKGVCEMIPNFELLEALVGKRLAIEMKKNTISGLHFQQKGIDNDAVKILAPFLAKMTVLEFLDLSGNSIGNEGAKSLAPVLAKMPALEQLYLHENNIGDEGVKALAPFLANMPVLEGLNLSENKFGNEGAKALGPILTKVPALKDFRFGGIYPYTVMV